MNRRPHVEIAGAGFAGLAAAAALAQRGWSVRVHERGPAFRDSGAGILVFENGLRVLRALGAYEDAVRGAHMAVTRETRDASGRLVSTVPFSADGRTTFIIVRQQLLEALHLAARRAGAEVVTSSEAVAADPRGELVLADGSRLPADLVIAADGVNSAIRDGLGLLKSRRQLGDGGIRVLIPRLPKEVEDETGQRVVEHWSGKRRVLYAACSSDSLYLALTTLLRDDLGRSLPLDVGTWGESFPHLRSLFERIGEGGRWDAFENIRLREWSAGRVAILGDAAHAQPPNLGQGGGCAMMNALALAVTVQQAPDIPTALRLWEQRERPLTDHTQRVSTLYGVIGKWPDGVRNRVLGLCARSSWISAQRMRTAHHHPTGT